MISRLTEGLIVALLFLFPANEPKPLGNTMCNATADAGPDITACSNDGTVQLNGVASGDVSSFFWSPPDGLSDPFSLNPFVTLSTTTTYTLTVESPENINLIVNGDFEIGNTAFFSDYGYVDPSDPLGLINPSTYTVVTSPALVSSAFPPCDDHTFGNGTGQMMVINGNGTVGANVWCQTISINPNTTYNFSAWVGSLINISPAQLQFSVNGMLIGSVFNASGGTCAWEFMNASWNSGSATTVDLCLVNQNPAGGLAENNFALDDIGMTGTCQVTDDVTITVIDVLANVQNPPLFDCNAADPCIQLDAGGSTMGPNVGYQWTTGNGLIQSGSDTPFPIVCAPGDYTLVVSNSENGHTCFSDPQTVTVTDNGLLPPVPVITGTSDPCQLTPYSYTIPDDPAYHDITWLLPANASILAGQGTNEVLLEWQSLGSVLLCIEVQNACGLPSNNCLPITINVGPTIDSLENTAAPCPGALLTYAVANPDPSVLLFNWTAPTGATIASGQGSSSVEVQWGTSGGQLCVTATNDCGDSTWCQLIVLQDSISTSIDTSICMSDSIFLAGAFQDTNGVYVDSLLSTHGCDSLVITSLTVGDSDWEITLLPTCDSTMASTTIDTLQNQQGCDSIVVVEVVYTGEYLETSTSQTCDSTLAGVFVDSLQTIAGCDSVIVLQVIYTGEYLETSTTQTCDSTLAGIFVDSLQTVDGCDSVIVLEVIYTGEYMETTTSQTCDSTLAGVFVDSLQTIAGCDSIVILEVIYTGEYIETNTTQTCDSTMAGIFADTLQTIHGCDSILIIEVIYTSEYLETTTSQTCDSTLAGIFIDSLQTIEGCDSIVILEVIYTGEYLEIITTQTCDSTSAGIFVDSLQTIAGCDSIVILEVIYTVEYFETTTTLTCDSTQAGVFTDSLQTIHGCDSVLISEVIYTGEYLETSTIQTCDSTMAGIFVDTLQTIAGCDSILILEVIYTGEYLETNTTQTCDSTMAGVFVDTLQTINGCDSILIVEVIYTDEYLETNTTQTCDSTLAGTFVDSLQTVAGCDSIVILEVIYTGEYLETTTTQTCDSTLAGVFVDSLQTLNGCDSILVLEVIYTGEYLETTTTQTCDSTLAGIFIDSLQTIAGCDSVIVLEVVYTGEYLETNTTQTCDSTLVGIFIDSLQTLNGCDSIVILEVIYTGEYLETTTSQTCDSTLTGIFVDTLQTIAGCDSIMILEVIYTGEYIETNTTQTCDSTMAGVFVDTLQTINGCDSILILEVLYTGDYLETSMNQTCDSTLAGIFVDSLQTIAGCDSIVILEVIYTNEYLETTTTQTCDSTMAGIFADTLQTIHGCDSILIIEVIYTSEYLETTTSQTCDSTLAGIFIDSLQTIHGCDSIIVSEVIYAGEYLETNTTQTCDSTVTGVFIDTLQTLAGCDSIIVLEVIYSGEYFETTTTLTCDSTHSGVFTDSLQTIHGCDSILILEVIYTGEYLEMTTNQTCDSTLAGVFVDTLQTIHGCDSILILEVVYTGEYLETITTPTCDSTLAGIFVDSLQTIAGCDSILWTEVIYVGSDTTRLHNFTCDSAATGTFITILSNAWNCDSVIVENVDLFPIDSCALEAEALGSLIPCTETEGIIELTVHIGAGPFAYQWEGPGLNPLGNGTLDSLQQIALIDGLSAGIYSITVTGANSLATVLTAEVLEQERPSLAGMTISDYGGFSVTCPEATDGTIEIVPAGGTMPYQVLWSEGSTGSLAEDLGAGWYTFTITDIEGCSYTDSVELSAPPPIQAELVIEQESCFEREDARVLVSTLNGGSAPTYLLSLDGANFQDTFTFPGLSSGQYTLQIVDDLGCETRETLQIPSVLPLIVDLGQDQVLPLGTSLYLQAVVNLQPSEIAAIQWSEALCGHCLDPLVMPTEDQVYEVVITDEQGCSASDEILLKVVNPEGIFSPSAFSPNGDGTNDLWILFAGPEVKQVVRLSIFDRWGETIYFAQNFSPNDPAFGWDGTFRGEELDPAVFVFQAEVEFLNGQRTIIAGDVTLIR